MIGRGITSPPPSLLPRYDYGFNLLHPRVSCGHAREAWIWAYPMNIIIFYMVVLVVVAIVFVIETIWVNFL